MQPAFLSRLFELSYGTLFRNLEGVTHEESLLEPQPAGNCLNWVLGHIMASRNRVLPLVGVAALWPSEQSFLYSGREEALWSAARALSLESIETDLARSQQQLLSALDNMTSASLAAHTQGGQSLGDVLGFLHFHEAYHGGQIALLRRLAGHSGAIRPESAPRRPGAYST